MIATYSERIDAYVAIVDTKNHSTIAAFQDVCDRMGVECIITPGVLGRTAMRSEASWMHGDALNWAWEAIIMDRLLSTRV